MAFVQNTTPTMAKQPQNGKVQIANADGTTQKTVYTAGASGSKVTALLASSTDTANRDVQVSITNAGTSYPLGTKTVPLASGTTAAVPTVNLLDPASIIGLAMDSDGNPYIHLVSGDTLTVSALVAVTAAKLITVVAPSAADF